MSLLARRRTKPATAGEAPSAPDWLAAYHRDGYALVHNVFSLTEVAAMKEAAAYVETHPACDREMAPNGATRIAFWPSLLAATLDGARTDSRMLALVQLILGTTSLRSGTSQLYYRTPGDPDAFQWHRDVIFRDAMEAPERYVQAAIFLDDVTAIEQGAIVFVPGSHRAGDVDGLWTLDDVAKRKGGAWDMDDRYGPVQPALVTAGSVGLWHPLVIHGSQPNTTERSRRYYMCGYADADAVGDAYPWAFREGEAVRHG